LIVLLNKRGDTQLKMNRDIKTRLYTEDWIEDTTNELVPIEFSNKQKVIKAIDQWIEDDNAFVSSAADLLHGIRRYLALY
jgi:hypothetical protein